MSKELKPCPFCGDVPDVETKGACIDITCCCSMSFQKCDCLTLREQVTFNIQALKYSEESEAKAYINAITAWNTRVSPWISVEDRLPEKPKKNEDYFFKEKYGSYQARTLFNSTYDMIKGDLRNMFTHWMPIPSLPKENK